MYEVRACKLRERPASATRKFSEYPRRFPRARYHTTSDYGNSQNKPIKKKLLTAHCFWSDVEGLAPSSRFAVAAGKLYRPWSAPSDHGAQLRDVNDIVIPKRFRGVQTNFQDDIAIVYVSNPFDFNKDAWPVCVDFDLMMDRAHLTAGNLGKVAGWGLIDEDGRMSPELQVVHLPYVEIDQCIVNASPDFRTYITSDKICAGLTNGTALCKGDSGGGLVFAKTEERIQRYYLRGVASTAPNNDKLCNTQAIPTQDSCAGAVASRRNEYLPVSCFCGPTHQKSTPEEMAASFMLLAKISPHFSTVSPHVAGQHVGTLTPHDLPDGGRHGKVLKRQHGMSPFMYPDTGASAM
ncbi:Modular serine protease [Eumeta japonica]|uniref:Modular serine protease n=1 Tax=Eumeta variegata TaxID=151549 RepID=A0A4C1SAB4_EUMVA|nr:Modular serine protease [Eumeta japonica]